jgi:hypothetical protein
VDFVSYVKRVIAVTDPGPRPGLTIIFNKFDKFFDRIIIISQFLFIDLRKKIRKKYPKSIRINKTFTIIFIRLNNSEMKWLIRILLRNYNYNRIPEILVIRKKIFAGYSDFSEFIRNCRKNSEYKNYLLYVISDCER